MPKITSILFAFLLVCLPMFNQSAMAESYIVQPGDHLWKISKKQGTSVEGIANLNKLMSITIQPGQYLEIPETYIVSEGDTLHNISKKLGFPKDELLEANPQIKHRDWIYPGQIIHFPNKNMVYMGDSSKKRIALTFDDGPDDTYTPQILEILKQKGVKATFFVMGERARKHPEQLRKIHKEGHVIGNHTWDHPNLTELSDQQLNENIQSTSAEIEKITGVEPELFRPPFGEIEDRQLEMLNEQGYRSIMWTADSKDWTGITEDEIVSKVMQDASPGVIVLQHNYHLSGNFETVEALPRIIDQLRAQGYEFVTVPTLVGKN